MTKTDLAIPLALGAAFFVAVGDVIRQRSAQEMPGGQVGGLRLLLQLLRDRRWWLGSLVAVAGFGLQAAALAFGSVLLVSALLVTSLLFALPLGAHYAGRPVSRAQWVWAALLATAVAVIVTVGNPAAGRSRAEWEQWAAVAAVLGPVLLLCTVAARAWAGRPAAPVLLGAVSGSLWGVFAVLTKGVVDRIGLGAGAVLVMPEFYAWAAVAVTATAWQQSAFRAGSIAASLPAMAVSEPIVASVLGIVVLGESMRPSQDGWLALVAAVALTVVAVAALARSSAAPAGCAGGQLPDGPAPARR